MTDKIDNKTKALLEAQSVPDLERHQRLCTVCQHPERDAIEESFLQWRCVSWINRQFEISNRNALYRHAHATGLFSRRGRRLRFALEHMIEQADQIIPTGDHILRAIRDYSCLDDEGKWHEPSSHVIVSSGSALPRTEAIPVEASLLPSAPSLEAAEPLLDHPFLIETSQEIENAATD